MKTYSLRRTTFLSLMVPMLLSLVLVAGAGLLSARWSIAVLRDHEMEQEAVFLHMLAVHEAAEGEQLGIVRSSESFGLGEVQAKGAGFRIWAGNLVMTSAGTLPPAGPAPPAAGFADFRHNGQSWRRYVATSPAPDGQARSVTVEIAEPTSLRSALTWRMVRLLVLPMLGLIVTVAAIATLRLTAAIRPIADLSLELDRRDSTDLTPLAGSRIPEEVAPLVAAINELMQRLGQTISREREFAANAAHELRTPLAALKARAQATQQVLADNPTATASLEALNVAVDRTVGAMEHLLLLSEVDRAREHFGPVDLSALTTVVAREFAPAALARDQELDARITPGLCLHGNADTVAILLRNLLDNAVRYTGSGQSIRVTLEACGGQELKLKVEDSGAGLRPEQREAAYERYQRFNCDVPGNGLGLAITQRIVELHGGSIVLADSDLGGLAAIVRLPLQP